MTNQSVILFDVDGVLLHPVGYKEAMHVSVSHFVRLMGQTGPVGPTYEDIALFEAHGFTNEWDTSAMCVAQLVLTALEQAPHLAGESLLDTLAAIRQSGLQIERPDFGWLADEVAARRDGPRPHEFALDILVERAPSETHPALHELLADAYQLHTPTTRVFQHHTLGSQRFATLYGEGPDFEAVSLLETKDRPLLSAEMRERLLAWVDDDSQHAVIFTARPSLPPVDAYEERPASRLEIAPEAEIARELLELDSLPLMSTGRIAWLAAGDGVRPEDYIKPSPVQSLAAIGAALSRTETPALEAAAAFAQRGEVVGPLVALEGRSTRVTVFEDSMGGIASVRAAVELLRGAGLDVTLEAVGVAPEPVKQEALAKVASRVVNDVNEGLQPILSNPH
jgi:hypothetical protein